MDQLKSQKKRKGENFTEWRKKKSNIQVAAVQSGEMDAIGSESIAVSTKRSSRDFNINDMKNLRTAKRFFRCAKMEINKNNKDANKKMKIMDTLQNEIQNLEVAILKDLARKRLNAKSSLTVASEVKSEKPKRTRYIKHKTMKRSKTESASGTRTVPHIESGELEFAAEHTASPMKNENNGFIISSYLNANKHSVKKRTTKSTVSRSTYEVKTENTNSLEGEKRNYSLPNELGIKIVEVWSLDKETESDEPVSLEQSNESLKTENAAVLSKNVTIVKSLRSGRITASEAEYEAVKAILRKWAGSEKKVVTKSVTKNGSYKSHDQVNGNFKKKKENLPTVYRREQFYNSVPPSIHNPAYLNISPNIQTVYPSCLNLPSYIQMGNPACTNFLPTVQMLYPAYQNILPTIQMGYLAYPNTPQIGYPAYLNSHPGPSNSLQSFGGIPEEWNF